MVLSVALVLDRSLGSGVTRAGVAGTDGGGVGRVGVFGGDALRGLELLAVIAAVCSGEFICLRMAKYVAFS